MDWDWLGICDRSGCEAAALGVGSARRSDSELHLRTRMATIIVLSDVHGNFEALRAAWEDIQLRPFDALYFLGDAAAFGPQPDECVTMLRDTIQPTASIAGNTDRYLVSKSWESGDADPEVQKSLSWTHDRLSAASKKWLSKLPASANENIAGCAVELVHGAPGDDERPVGPGMAPDELDKLFAKHDAGVTFCGHTHVPWRGRVGEREIMNAGSIGLPFDGDERASYLRLQIVDGLVRDYECRRVRYQTETVIAQLEEAAAPWRETLTRRIRFALRID